MSLMLQMCTHDAWFFQGGTDPTLQLSNRISAIGHIHFLTRTYFKHHRFLFFFINGDIGAVDPGICAQMSKPDIGVPKESKDVDIKIVPALHYPA